MSQAGTIPRGGGWRWSGAAGAVVALHGLVIAVLGPWALPPPSLMLKEQAVLVDLAPAVQRQPETPAETPPAEVPPPDFPPPDPPSPEPPPPEPPPSEVPPPDPVVPEARTLPQSAPEVPMPPPPPRHPPPIRPSVQSVQPTPAAVAPTSLATIPRSSPMPPASAVTESWQTRLVARLNRFRRYPAAALMQHKEGVALVRLRLMPDGSVQGVALARGSGTESLDQEAVALVGRAQPLPVPETGLAVEIVVPVQFTLR